MQFRDSGRWAARLIGAALIAAILASLPVSARLGLPGYIRIARGQVQEFRLSLPVPVTVRSTQDGVLQLNGSDVGPYGRRLSLSGPVNLASVDLGQTTLDFRLFGWIPFRRMTVDVVPPVQLVPGGHSIGVLLRSNGVIVVGHAGVREPGGRVIQPGRSGGVEIGDVIVSINGTEVDNEQQAAGLIEEAGRHGEPVDLVVKRRGRPLFRHLQPVLDRASGRWRVGLYIRDGTAGVGTLTFYEPQTRKYGALGHVVADAETNQPVEVRGGHIVQAAVTSIEKGERNHPGEKVAIFIDEDQWIGSVERNTRHGIFGTMQKVPDNPFYPQPVPVALASQVKEGAAEILTVVGGQRLERFGVEILRVNREAQADGKNLVVRITDPRLIARTRGIVQGMSGSPILQDGRLVGAVTHVFVSDPSRGYGVLIEYMLQEAGMLDSGRSRAWGSLGERKLTGARLLPARVCAVRGHRGGLPVGNGRFVPNKAETVHSIQTPFDEIRQIPTR